MAALSAAQQEVLTALQDAGVRGSERFRDFLAGLHTAYYRTVDDFKQATREGLATVLPAALVDSIMACQAGQDTTIQQLHTDVQRLVETVDRLIQLRHTRVTASDASNSNVWRDIKPILCGKYHTPVLEAPCCFNFQVSGPGPECFLWKPARDENHQDNVKKVKEFLTANVLPDGVKVIALQGREWLTACIDCGSTGSLLIANSKTDYVFLLDSGYQKLQHANPNQLQTEPPVTEDLLKLMLPHLVGLFESKTTYYLGSGEGAMHQALLEFLAVNKMRLGTSDSIPVLAGDCNKWWCIHAGAEANVVHQMRPPLLAAVSEKQRKSDASMASTFNDAGFMKAILTQARDARLRGLRESEAGASGSGSHGARPGGNSSQGGRGSSGGGDGQGRGDRQGRGGDQGHGGGKEHGGHQGGGESQRGGGGKVETRAQRGRQQATHAVLAREVEGGGGSSSQGDGSSQGRGSNQTGSSYQGAGSSQGSCGAQDRGSQGGSGRGSTCWSGDNGHDDAELRASSDGDQGTHEAVMDHVYTQQMYAHLQRPEVYQSYGLLGPPKSFTPPDAEAYAHGKRIIFFDGCW